MVHIKRHLITKKQVRQKQQAGVGELDEKRFAVFGEIA